MGDNGEIGLCCEDVSENIIPNLKLNIRKTILASTGRVQSSQISNNIVAKSSKAGHIFTKNITALAAIESKRGGSGNDKGTPEYSHSRFQRQRKGVYELGQYALTSTITAVKILETARKGNLKITKNP